MFSASFVVEVVRISFLAVTSGAGWLISTARRVSSCAVVSVWHSPHCSLASVSTSTWPLSSDTSPD